MTNKYPNGYCITLFLILHSFHLIAPGWFALSYAWCVVGQTMCLSHVIIGYGPAMYIECS